MKPEIESLLANLDSSTIDYLPCFIDQDGNPTDINFRIGYLKGPQIIFKSDSEGLYYLTVIDIDQKSFKHSILVDSDQFDQCQRIRDSIYSKRQTEDYLEKVEKKASILITNVANIIKPIIDRLPQE